MSGSNPSVPPPPRIEIEPLGGPPGLTGSVLTDWPLPNITGAVAGDGMVRLVIDGMPGVTAVPIDGTFAVVSLLGVGLHTMTAVQIDAAGTSAPSNMITVFDAPTPSAVYNGGTVEQISPVNLSYGQFESLVAQGFQLDLYAPTQALQFTDGLYDVNTGAFTPQSADPFATNASAPPPPPQIAFEPSGIPPDLTGSILTDWPAPTIAGTAIPATGKSRFSSMESKSNPVFSRRERSTFLGRSPSAFTR